MAVKRLVGHLPGDLPQFSGVRGREVVSYVAGLRGGLEAGRVARLAERLDLDLSRRFREYSRGNKQKLGLVLAFMHDPHLLILDEPTGGLDPLNQQEFYRVVAEARIRGSTVFLSSHVLSEVERVCERVSVEGQRLTSAVRGSFNPLLAALERGEVLNLVSHEPSLEEIFLASYRNEPGEVGAEAAPR